MRNANTALRESHISAKSEIHDPKSSKHRVTPDECGLTSSDGDPGTNGATSKTRCGTGNEHQRAHFASGDFFKLTLRRCRRPVRSPTKTSSENTARAACR